MGKKKKKNFSKVARTSFVFSMNTKSTIDDGEGVGRGKRASARCVIVHASSKNKFCLPDEHQVMVSLKWWRKGESSWLDKP